MAINCEGCFAPCCLAASCPLLVDGKCADYANRPDICNTDTMFDRHYSKVLTREQFDEFNRQACDKLREIHREQQ